MNSTYQQHLTLVKELVGKTIINSELDKDENLILTLDNGMVVSVNYDCYGGVLLFRETKREVELNE